MRGCMSAQMRRCGVDGYSGNYRYCSNHALTLLGINALEEQTPCQILVAQLKWPALPASHRPAVGGHLSSGQRPDVVHAEVSTQPRAGRRRSRTPTARRAGPPRHGGGVGAPGGLLGRRGSERSDAWGGVLGVGEADGPPGGGDDDSKRPPGLQRPTSPTPLPNTPEDREAAQPPRRRRAGGGGTACLLMPKKVASIRATPHRRPLPHLWVRSPPIRRKRALYAPLSPA